jgi:forkhead box protein J2/3
MSEHTMEQHQQQLEQQDQGDGNYYQEHGEYEDNGELSLDMLKDSPPGVKPLYPFSTLIR